MKCKWNLPTCFNTFQLRSRVHGLFQSDANCGEIFCERNEGRSLLFCSSRPLVALFCSVRDCCNNELFIFNYMFESRLRGWKRFVSCEIGRGVPTDARGNVGEEMPPINYYERKHAGQIWMRGLSTPYREFIIQTWGGCAATQRTESAMLSGHGWDILGLNL